MKNCLIGIGMTDLNDTSITIERLKEARCVFREYRELQDQIQAAYNTYHSPQFDYVKSSNGKADPVVLAFHKIEKLNDQLDNRLGFISDFENDLLRINNYEVQAIIRYRYILGYTWSQTSRIIYKQNDPSAARHILNRYLDKSAKENYDGL